MKSSLMQRMLALVSIEVLKLRRTSVGLLLVIAPYAVVLFFLVFAWFDGDRFLKSGVAWQWLIEAAFTFFSLIVLPLWVAIISAQVATVEHRSRGFRRLFVLPLNRLEIYGAKQLVMWTLTALAYVGLTAAICIGGLVLRWLRPGLGFEEPLDFQALLTLGTACSLASCFLVAMHTWLALVRDDVAAPIGTGILMTMSVLVVLNLDPNLVSYHPWAYPSRLVAAWTSGDPSWPWAMAGSLGGLLFAWVAGRSFIARDVQ